MIPMRMIVVAGLLTMALLAAVLGSVGGERPAWVSAPDEFNGPPAREISDRVPPEARVFDNRG
jgi:hypothetical protein